MQQVAGTSDASGLQPLIAHVGGAISDDGGQIFMTGPVDVEDAELAPPDDCMDLQVTNEPDTRQVRFAEACDTSPDEDLTSAQCTHKKRETVADERKKKAQRMKDVKRAQCAYESFFRMEPGSAKLKDLEKSSAGVAGWLTFADALDRIQSQHEKEHQACREEQERGLRCRDLLETTGVMDQVLGQVAAMPMIGRERLDFGTLGPKPEPAISIMETSHSTSSINLT